MLELSCLSQEPMSNPDPVSQATPLPAKRPHEAESPSNEPAAKKPKICSLRSVKAASPMPVSHGATHFVGGVDVVERTEIFFIRSSANTLPKYDIAHEDLQLARAHEPSRMLVGTYCPKETVEQLWTQKTRMDEIFDAGKEDLYYKARDTIFPQDKRGSANFKNRAGDKLWEVTMITRFITNSFRFTKLRIYFLAYTMVQYFLMYVVVQGLFLSCFCKKHLLPLVGMA